MTKNCIICGKEFEALGRVITCGPACSRTRKRSRRQTPQYKACRRAYRQTPAYKAYERARFASPEYKLRRHALYHSPEHKARRLASRHFVIKTCIVCGKKFVAIGNAKTCGDNACWQVNRQKYKHRRRIYNKIYHQSLEYKSRVRAYNQRPERKDYNQRRRQTQEYKKRMRAIQRAYYKSPKAKSRVRAYRQAAKYKLWQSSYMRARYYAQKQTRNLFQAFALRAVLNQTTKQQQPVQNEQ